MRYQELFEARPWKQYRGWWHRVRLVRLIDGDSIGEVIDCHASLGSVVTGRTQTFAGYYVRICAPQGAQDDWLGEHPRSLYKALQRASEAAHLDQFTLLALGLTPQYKETGLNANTGFGSHPAFPERHVHMLEIPPSDSTTPY